MQKFIWILGLWLVGIGQVAAFDLKKPEVIDYKVYWGVFQVGDAHITYVPNGSAYVLRAAVKDTSSLMNMDDSWESRGIHTPARAFVPQVYSVKQVENDYRADKTMTFDAKANVVTYRNAIDPTDVADPFVMGDVRDALATVFAWRVNGVNEVKRAGETDVVNIKKVVTLKRDAGVLTTLKLGNRTVNVWKINMITLKNGKPTKTSWVVYLRDDATLAPVQIVVSTKFGTFKATLAD